jgi:hypothetical protein
MTILKAPAFPFMIAGLVGTVFAAHRTLALGVACFLVTSGVKMLDGIKGILGSYRLGPADADDPESPVALVRIGRKVMVVVIAILCAMSLGLAFAALRTDDSSVRTLSAAFAIVALVGGPFTSVKRRPALWTATGVAAVGTFVSLLV